jgi:hypothetical protein
MIEERGAKREGKAREREGEGRREKEREGERRRGKEGEEGRAWKRGMRWGRQERAGETLYLCQAMV